MTFIRYRASNSATYSWGIQDETRFTRNRRGCRRNTSNRTILPLKVTLDFLIIVDTALSSANTTSHRRGCSSPIDNIFDLSDPNTSSSTPITSRRLNTLSTPRCLFNSPNLNSPNFNSPNFNSPNSGKNFNSPNFNSPNFNSPNFTSG